MHTSQRQPTTDPAEAAITEIATVFAAAILHLKSRRLSPKEASLRLFEPGEDASKKLSGKSRPKFHC